MNMAPELRPLKGIHQTPSRVSPNGTSPSGLKIITGIAGPAITKDDISFKAKSLRTSPLNATLYRIKAPGRLKGL
jgi:hypothetical protein